VYSIQRPRRRLWRFGSEGVLVCFDKGLQDAAIVGRQPPEFGVAARFFDIQKGVKACGEGQGARLLAELVGGNGRQRDAGHHPEQTEA
jgi:hypothetical protein